VFLCYAGLAVVHAAEKVLATSFGSSSKKQPGKQQQQQSWVPLLPAACAALPAVLVHTEGVTKTAALLLQAFEDWQSHQPAVAAAAGRQQQKGTKQAAPTQSNATVAAAVDMPCLLALPVMNSFFTAAADVASAAAAADDEEAAAAAAADAVRVAEVLFARQLLQVKTGLASSSSSSSSEQQPLLSPDAQTYAALTQLYGAAGQYKTVASIVMAAVRQQLPIPATPNSSSSRSSRAEVVQTVLAGAAAADSQAGRAAAVACLLDGLIASGQGWLSHPGLAAAVLAAADDDLEVKVGGCTWQAACFMTQDVGFVEDLRC
jgi:hypothetical protein